MTTSNKGMLLVSLLAILAVVLVKFPYFSAPAMANNLDSQALGLYNTSCATCHASGVLGAPKTGDKANWSARMKQGIPQMIAHTKMGFKNMPARGLCDTCSDADYEALIKFMAQ